MGTARSMDRRSFLKGATVAGAAAAAAGTLGLAGCAPQDKETVAAASGDLVLDAEKFTNAKWNFEIPPEPVDESKIGNTVECEILVIGAGVGGLVTATSAVTAIRTSIRYILLAPETHMTVSAFSCSNKYPCSVCKHTVFLSSIINKRKLKKARCIITERS